MRKLLLTISLFLMSLTLHAQVSSVTFGKNKIQYKKFEWQQYQTTNYNIYTTVDAVNMGKFVAQVAEQERVPLEDFIENTTTGRTDIIVYNSYDEYKQSNIGLLSDWQSANGVTKFVHNKLIVYFDGDHSHLKNQIKEGIAQVLVNGSLSNEDLDESSRDNSQFDLPTWLVDGYIAYSSEKWNTKLDDLLRTALLSRRYTKFSQLIFDNPELAGHAFWYFLAEKYSADNVGYFLFVARNLRSVNKASKKITKKSFKALQEELMEFETNKYDNDLSKRRNVPKGKMVATDDADKVLHYRFQANPNPKNTSYALVEFKDGVYAVKLVENFSDETVLWRHGVLTRQHDVNPNYPIIAWNGSGSKILIIYWLIGSVQLRVYDIIARRTILKQTIENIDQILDASYGRDDDQLLLSAVHKGHSDIYIYQIAEKSLTKITNDIYDDLTPSFVSFPNRTGILFASNRPISNASINDSVLPSKYNYNIFITDIHNNNSNKRVTQLTHLKHGNASSPMQYNANYFTFQSDETGIKNRWAGAFFTARNGLDTVYYVGHAAIQNPTEKELAAALFDNNKQEADSVRYYQIFEDSAYTFPITNYQNSIMESRQAGNNGQISEVLQNQSGQLLVYQLKPDDKALATRNIKTAMSTYMSTIIANENKNQGNVINMNVQQDKADAAEAMLFQTEFQKEPLDSAIIYMNQEKAESQSSEYILKKIREVEYHTRYNITSVVASLDNNVLLNKFQPYANGTGPVVLSQSPLNLSIGSSITDLMEDYRLSASAQISSLTDKTILLSYHNYKRRIDWGLSYYRQNQSNYGNFFTTADTMNIAIPGIGSGTLPKSTFENMFYTNIYQFNVAYPFDETRSIRATIAYRNDRMRVRPYYTGNGGALPILQVFGIPDSVLKMMLTHFEYVYDNTISPAKNIRNGLRYKVYMDVNIPLNGTSGKPMFNVGFDIRKYVKIYRNFIWAGRVGGDFSWGQQKIIYYLGGVDGWLSPKFNNNNKPDPDNTYRFQSLSENMRGYTQNAANGNNAVVLNSEFRFPIFTTLISSPINNAFLRNFQLIQFFDLGTAWNGNYSGIKRPQETFTNNNGIKINVDLGGIGPFAAGYGFGARSTINLPFLGSYFTKVDCAWPMRGFFKGAPIWYFAFGLDF